MRLSKNIFLLLVVVFTSIHGRTIFAQDIVEVTKLLQIKADDAASAKQQLMSEAIETLSFDSIKNIIGEEKLDRSKELIKNKVIKHSDKYILSIRGLNFQKKESLYLMDVEMKLSLKALRTLLLEQGLLYQIDGPPKVLPIVEVTDRIGAQSFGWWYQPIAKEHRFLSEQLGSLHVAFRDEMQKIGFYVMSPISAHLVRSVPEAYRIDNLQKADYLFLGDYFKCSIVLRGEIFYKLKPNTENIYLIDVRIEALHSSNGRLLAEVARVYETDAGSSRVVIPKKIQEVSGRIAEDLSLQLADTWKKGTFGASIVKLTVVGKINPKVLEEFKNTIIIQVRDIKSLRERLIEADKVTFEVDSSVLAQQLAQTLTKTKLNGFKIEIREVVADEVTIKVEAL